MSIDRILHEKYPPSQPCNCKICIDYCKRPGWWTVNEAERAIAAGLHSRMMLEDFARAEFWGLIARI